LRSVARLRFFLVWLMVISMMTIWIAAVSMETTAASEQIRYLSDSVNDSTKPDEFPWGEIREILVENDTITIKSNGIIFPGAGYFLLFFDENFDNITDVVLKYSKGYNSVTGRMVEYCYLCRPSNRSYYYEGAWNSKKGIFDPQTEENATLGQTTFHLGGAIKGVLRLKMLSYYIYARGPASLTKGGDTVPDCPWEVDDLTNPAYIENLAQIVNDTRFLYPHESFLVEEPAPPPPPPPPTIFDLAYGLFSSAQNWVAENSASTVLLLIFSLAAVYSIAGKMRAVLNVALAYFLVTVLIYATTFRTSSLLPFLLSIGLLAPLFLWYRGISNSLSSVLKVQKRRVWVEISALFLFTLAIRLYVTIFAISLPLETPLVYLIILTMVLIKGNTLGAYGLELKSFAKSLLIGLAYCLTFGFPFFLTLSALTFLSTGQLAFSTYSVSTALIYLPFMILCVGLSEEGLFRGFIQTRLAKAYNKNAALLTQAVLFAAWQFAIFVSPMSAVGMAVYISQTFAFGLISGLFYKKSGNLIPLILANGFLNTAILLVTNRFEIYETEPFFGTVLGISISAGLIVQLIFTKYLADKARVETETNNQGGI
jgi:membrane protease YdiL (CAAX protease family)